MKALMSLRWFVTASKAAVRLTIAVCILLPLTLGLVVLAGVTSPGVIWLAALTAVIAFVVTGVAWVHVVEGYRPAAEVEYEESLGLTWIHRSRTIAGQVGDIVLLDPAFCRRRARMKRSDRPRLRRPTAVYFATTDDGETALIANGVHQATTILEADLRTPPPRKHCFFRPTGDIAVTTAVLARIVHVEPANDDT